MEIDIQSKTNNPLLKRTEVQFTIHHEGEGTPKRELVRSELADKLKVKKENIMINYMKASFGNTETLGYAKVYKSVEAAKVGEKKYILIRNNVVADEKKKPKEEKPVPPPVKKEEEPAEKPADKTLEETPEEKPEGDTEKTEENIKPEEEKKEETEKPPEQKE
jgi:ribosomal protein S24E